MKNLLRTNRAKLSKDLNTIEKREGLSPSFMALSKALLPEIPAFLTGKFLDIGCGETPFRNIIAPHVQTYVTTDIERRTDKIDYVCDIQNMSPIQDNMFDSAGCFDVLEHVPDPVAACREMARILKPGGYLIVTTPFLARLHEIPHDYYRFTEYGLRRLFEPCGFDTVLIKGFGGPFSFLGHQVSTLLVCSTWHIPVVKWIVFILNKWMITKTCFHLDRFLNISRQLPSGYLSIYIKSAEQTGNSKPDQIEHK